MLDQLGFIVVIKEILDIINILQLFKLSVMF